MTIILCRKFTEINEHSFTLWCIIMKCAQPTPNQPLIVAISCTTIHLVHQSYDCFLFQLVLVLWTINMSFRQTCKVRVTGRNMRYQRALQIVQDEEYLSAIDLDDIRRYRRKFQIKRRKWKKHVRKKRQESCKYLNLN